MVSSYDKRRAALHAFLFANHIFPYNKFWCRGLDAGTTLINAILSSTDTYSLLPDALAG